jgi:UDP-N-acetylmuramate--alanine ligase
VYITEIYAASEAPIPGINGERLARAIREAGHPSVTWIAKREDLASAVLPQLRPGDLVLTLGAGDIWKVGPELLEGLG